MALGGPRTPPTMLNAQATAATTATHTCGEALQRLRYAAAQLDGQAEDSGGLKGVALVTACAALELHRKA